MKQILLILTFALLISCQKQERDTYLIKGNIKEIPDSIIIDLYIQYDNMGLRVSSDTIINGQFEFTDTLENRPSKMSIKMRDWNNCLSNCDLWVDYEVINITGSGKNLSAWVPSGTNKELIALNRLKSQTRELSVIIDSLNMEIMHNREDRELSKHIRGIIDSIQQISYKIQFSLIEENPNSQSALELLYHITKFDTSINKNKIKDVYNRMDTTYQNTLFGEGILSILEEKEIPEIGDKMVNFFAYDTIGQMHSLEEFKGKYILLDFWALACGPCIYAIPETRKLHSKNKDILTIIGLNMITNEDMWRKISKKDSITWINLSDGKGTFAGVSKDYGIEGVPTYILIDPNGIIVERWMGYWPDVFKQKLSKHIEGINI